MYCNRLHAWWSTLSRLATLLSSLIARQWVGLQTLWWFPLKALSVNEMVGAWCFGCLSGPSGFYVLWFLLLRYSVLFTVESLSLLYLLFISWLYILGDDALISKGSFMKTKHLCVIIHIWTKSEVGTSLNQFKPSSKKFYWPFQGGASFVDHLCYSCLVLLCFHARLFVGAL